MALKTKKLVALFVGLTFFLAVVGSIFVCLNMPVLDMPIVQIFAPHEELEYAKDYLEELADDVEDLPLHYEEEVEDVLEMDIDRIADKLRAPSINTLIAFSEVDDFDIPNDVRDALSVIRIVLIIWFANVAIFALLGALLKKKAFTIVAMAVGALYFIFFVSIWLTILFFMLAIGHLVCISLINKELASINTQTVTQ